MSLLSFIFLQVFTFPQHPHITGQANSVAVVKLMYFIRIHTNISTMVGDHSNEDYWGLPPSIWRRK